MFLVLKLPRTGSTMLGDVLDSHPDISCKKEILNHLKDSDIKDKLNYLYNFYSNNLKVKNQDKKQIIGCTITLLSIS